MTEYQIIELFEQIVGHTSSKTQIPFLTASDRLTLLIDIALGHPPVRGGRARDYQFSLQHRDSLKFSLSLHNKIRLCEPGENSKTGTYRVYDWVVALLGLILTTDLRDEELANGLMLAIIQEMFIPDMVPVASERMGLFQADYDSAVNARQRADVVEFVELSRCLAVLSRDAAQQKEKDIDPRALATRYAISNAVLDRLQSEHRYFIFIKPRHIQMLINRCKTVQVQRGASAFCLQIVSRIRDLLLAREDLETRLVSDNGAITLAVTASPCKAQTLAAELREALMGNQEILRSNLSEWYPRLGPYANEAIRQKIPLERALPEVGLRVTGPVSLLSLAADTRPLDERPRKSTSLNITDPVIDEFGAGSCNGCDGENMYDSLAFRTARWRRRSEKEPFGWVATAFSLAERGRQLTVRRGIQDEIDEEIPTVKHAGETHLQMVRRVSELQRLCYVRVDGDRVGRQFRAVPSLSRPGRSIVFGAHVRNRWQEAILQTMKRRNLYEIPVEVVFYAGDDMMFALPEDCLMDFLVEFANASEDNILFGNVEFTLACCSFPIDALGDLGSRKTRLDVLRFLPDFLEIAKTVREGERQLPAVAQLDLPPGLLKEWDLELCPMDCGLLGGLILRLFPRAEAN